MSTQLVQEGFSKIAQQFAEVREPFDYRRELVEFARQLPPKGSVLDSWCGV